MSNNLVTGNGLHPPAFEIVVTAVEHFAGLHQTGIADIDGRPVLVNRSRDGGYEVFDELVFHGGQGSTLEMRVFSESDIRVRLTAAGLAAGFAAVLV